MSVTVNKFKFVDKGVHGVKISGTETREKGDAFVVVDIDLVWKVPVPEEIVQTVQRLKKYLLELCGYWHPRYDNFIKKGQIVDQPEGEAEKSNYMFMINLMEKTEVTGLVKKGEHYILTGKLENDCGATVALSTPLTGPHSGFHKWDFLSRGCRTCLGEMDRYVNDRKLRMMTAKQFMMEFAGNDPEKIDTYSSMSDTDLLNLQIKNLEDAGCIVTTPDDMAPPEEKPESPGMGEPQMVRLGKAEHSPAEAVEEIPQKEEKKGK